MSRAVRMFEETFQQAGGRSMIFTAEVVKRRKQFERTKSVQIHRKDTIMDTINKQSDSYLRYKVLCANQEFYSILPNYNISEFSKNQMFKTTKRLGQRNATVKSFQSKGEGRFSIYKERQVLIDERIYSPFLLTNSMIVQFNKHPEKELLSIRDIMKTFIQTNNKEARYYFKVFQFAQDQTDPSKSSDFQGYLHTGTDIRRKDFSIGSELNTKRRGKQALSENDIGKEFYFEFEFKNTSFPSDIVNIEDCNQKFTFEDKLHSLTVKDITQIIKNQQKLSDRIYQEAIEANYSHEQMTPLNNILNNSVLLVKRFRQLHQMNKEHMQMLGINHRMTGITRQNEESMSIINSIN